MVAAAAATTTSHSAAIPAAAGTQGPAAAAAAATPTQDAKAAAEKERALAEKLDRRATIVVGILRKFINGFYAARQQMIDAARAAELARLARKGKKKGRKKKDDKKDDKKDAKGGKDKKPKKTPVQESWSTFLTDMDEKISKQKRVFLEDMYRGCAKLDAREQTMLSALLATTTKKILPTDTLNINQLNIKEAVTAGNNAALLAMAQHKADPSPNVGIRVLATRGVSGEQMMQHGYDEAALLRGGVPRHEVVALSQHSPQRLRSAGLGVSELLTAPRAPQLAARLGEGHRGVVELKQAGYTAREVVSAGLDNAWALGKAGFPLSDLVETGVMGPADLRAAGFGAAEAQPPGFLGGSMRAAMQDTHIDMLPDAQLGTTVPAWSSLLAARSPLVETAKAGGAAGTPTAGSAAGGVGGRRSPTGLGGRPAPNHNSTGSSSTAPSNIRAHRAG